MEETESEFGKGLTYNLGLFIAHKERYLHDKETYEKMGLNKECAGTWFNGASDHLYELEIPDSLPKKLRERLAHFRDKCLDLGRGIGLLSDKATEKDYDWAIREALDLLMEIDKTFGVKPIEGSWE